MSWIIGSPSIYGYGILMGDIQMTLPFFNPPRYYDCLQKIFPVANSFAYGYAGDVELGFFFGRDLNKALNSIPNGMGWFPDYFIYKYYQRRIRYLYNHLADKFRNRTIHIMIIATSPTKNDATNNTGFPFTNGYILKSPEFIVEKMERNKFYAIGSGNNALPYAEALNRLNRDSYNSLMQSEVRNSGGYGITIADYLRDIVRNNPANGISRHFLTALVKRGMVTMTRRETNTFDENGNVLRDPFPNIYANWNDIKSFLESEGISLADSFTCSA